MTNLTTASLETSEFSEYLTVAQAARVLGVTPARVRQLGAERKLSPIWTPLGRLFAKGEVEALREERTSNGK